MLRILPVLALSLGFVGCGGEKFSDLTPTTATELVESPAVEENTEAQAELDESEILVSPADVSPEGVSAFDYAD